QPPGSRGPRAAAAPRSANWCRPASGRNRSTILESMTMDSVAPFLDPARGTRSGGISFSREHKLGLAPWCLDLRTGNGDTSFVDSEVTPIRNTIAGDPVD